MNVVAPVAMTGNHMYEDLMTRRQEAYLFRGDISGDGNLGAVRRGRLPEVRDEAGRPRYRRADVEGLMRSGFRRKPR